MISGCWCARRDLNPHAREEHRHLKPASLPIPPLAHINGMPDYSSIFA